MGRRGAPLRSLPPAGPRVVAAGKGRTKHGIVPAALPSPASPAERSGAERSARRRRGRLRKVGPPSALTLASGGRISTWLFSSSFFAASFCANAELNDTFTMAGLQRPASRRKRTRSSPDRRSFAGCLLPCHPPRCYLGATAAPVLLSGG